jgi:hypothetical protein
MKEIKMNDEKQYDKEALEHLWKLDYDKLVTAPGEPNGRLREARFVMQAKVAFETRKLINSTYWMAVATFAMAIGTAALVVLEVLKR